MFELLWDSAVFLLGNLNLFRHMCLLALVCGCHLQTVWFQLLVDSTTASYSSSKIFLHLVAHPRGPLQFVTGPFVKRGASELAVLHPSAGLERPARQR